MSALPTEAIVPLQESRDVLLSCSRMIRASDAKLKLRELALAHHPFPDAGPGIRQEIPTLDGSNHGVGALDRRPGGPSRRWARAVPPRPEDAARVSWRALPRAVTMLG
jgi:hypothetical protein